MGECASSAGERRSRRIAIAPAINRIQSSICGQHIFAISGKRVFLEKV
jgi:hypothetical protein